MDEKDKIINEFRRENEELKKFSIQWKDVDNENPEDSDVYLVLWKSDNSHLIFYALENFDIDFGWDMESEVIVKYLKDGKKVELLYWAELPKMPDECYE